MRVLGRAGVVTALTVWAAGSAHAVELLDGKFSVNGYASIAYLQTNGNEYLTGIPGGSFDNVDMAILLTVKPTEDVHLLTQFTIASPEEAAVDFAFGEWRYSDQLRLRFGKVKQPVGIYNEIFDVGTLRPFITLPTVIYNFAGNATEAYFGVGATGNFELGGALTGWNLTYDLYGGNAVMETFEPFEKVVNGETFGEPEEDPTRGLVGGRLIANTPIDGLNLRISGFRGERPDAQVVVFGFSLEYLTDRLWLRSEFFREMELHLHRSHSAYLEVGYFLTSHWQVSGRLEGSWTFVDDLATSSSTTIHREAAVGLNYWINPQFVLKASIHGVDGNRFATPEDNVLATDPIPTQTTLYVAGAQFSF